MRIKFLFNKRSFMLGTIIIAATLVVSSDNLYHIFENIIKFTESIIYQFPTAAMLLFVILAMASAMLAFYSSTILVPIGVYTWGTTGCFILLRIGWILGGILSFGIGYNYGRTVATKLVGDSRFANFNNYIDRHAKFIHILLFQAALPSEVPGYLLGALRYQFSYYLMALAIAELPYAIGTVFLGANFLQRNSVGMLLLGTVAILASSWVYLVFRKHVKLANNLQ